MTDFNDPPTDATTPTATADRPRPAPGETGPDPLASLYKMSTTAGISSQEYVAINIPAVVALVLGLASIVAILHSILLVVPLAAIITAVVALSQIRDSNGTQTGRPFAWLGIVVSLAIGGYKLVDSVVERYQTHADRQAVAAKLDELGQSIRASDYDKAYKLFNGRFQSRVNREAFIARWEAAQAYPDLGRITSIQWNRTNIIFFDELASGTRVGYATAWVKFSKGAEPARYSFDFRKAGGFWEIDDSSSLFPADKPKRR